MSNVVNQNFFFFWFIDFESCAQWSGDRTQSSLGDRKIRGTRAAFPCCGLSSNNQPKECFWVERLYEDLLIVMCIFSSFSYRKFLKGKRRARAGLGNLWAFCLCLTRPDMTAPRWFKGPWTLESISNWSQACSSFSFSWYFIFIKLDMTNVKLSKRILFRHQWRPT